MAGQIKEKIKDLFSSKDDLDYPSGYNQQRIFTTTNGRSGPVPVLELRVPMCCEKCEEKVKEALEELDGVKNVVTDQYNQRVTVTGFVDPLKALRRVKKVKKKSEFFTKGTYVNRTSIPINNSVTPGVTQSRSMHVPVRAAQTRYTSNPLIRTHSSGFGRFPHEGKMAAMTPIMQAPPLVMQQPRPLVRVNSYGRRQPSYGRVASRHNALVPVDLHRDFTGIRRMPSFKNYRHHDAEYISMGDEFRPSMAESHYVSHHNQRPVILRSQVSFSRLPVTNPNYLKHIESEYY
jgi:copper chaperone CopZ